ncbi:MAG: hypothetical protein KAR19_00210 [Bacteroidales bacterium]|nr:hypothetical protein [Bacteroidales bacterium]
MVIFRNHLVLVLVACAWFLNGCREKTAWKYDIVHIEGVTWACNITTSYATFGSTYELEEQWEVSIPASDGDLLYMIDDGDLELYYRYRSEGGDHLLVTYDTVNVNSVYVNGVLNYFELSDDSVSWELFNGLPPLVKKQLSTLSISGSLTDEFMSLLHNQESSFRGIGLVLESVAGPTQLDELLSVFRPGWLALDGRSDLPGSDHGEFLADLDLMWITGKIQDVSKIIHCCSNLESLIIAEWEPKPGELVPLSGLKKLQSLTLAECSFEDFSHFELPASLKSLYLVGCDTLTDISGLEQISTLVNLGLAGSDDVEDLELINNLEKLKWLSFPKNVTQEEFNSILGKHPLLEVVELNDCPLVGDITMLQDHAQLKVLILNTVEYDLSQLAVLDQVELIVLNTEFFEDVPELIARLRTNLPNTEIVPGSGLCLGSGWLLLLLPLVVLVRFILKKTR